MVIKRKWAIFAALGVVLLLALNPASGAINTKEIKEVRKKEVLGAKDKQIIDDFVAEAVQELIETRDFSSIGQIRTAILTRASSNIPGAQAQYRTQFFDSAYKYISEALKQAAGLPEDRKFKVTVNLLILVDRLEDVRLADLGIGMLKDENTVIRYLAVHSVTNPGITKQLNSQNPDNSKLARRIAEQLSGLVDSSGPEIIALMAKFAADVKIPQGEKLLLQIADAQIKRHADWAVKHEFLNATILKSLLEKLSSEGAGKPATARRFAQLYSYVIQRYIKGRNYLSAAQKRRLASVLVETEHKCVRKKILEPTIKIRKAVEQGDYETLWLEHSRLLGDETRAGELARKLKFHYGLDPNGNERTAPLTLPEPPKTKVSE
jgi:hypothetical protein